MWRSPGLRKRRRRRSVEKVDGGEGPAAAEDDVFFDEDEFLTRTIFGTSANSTAGNGTAGMSESLSLFQSIHVLQADEHVNGTSAGQFLRTLYRALDRSGFDKYNRVTLMVCLTILFLTPQMLQNRHSSWETCRNS